MVQYYLYPKSTKKISIGAVILQKIKYKSFDPEFQFHGNGSRFHF